MNWIDRLAAKFGYVKVIAEQPPCEIGEPPLPVLDSKSPSARPEPSDFGLPSGVTFDAFRSGKQSSQPVDWASALDFLEACGIDLCSLSGEVTLATIFAGVPFHVDGADMVFKPRI